MKTLSAKLLLLILAGTAVTACNEQLGSEKSASPQQSVMVTAANETAVMARLRSIGVAEAQYMAESGGEYGTLDQLIQKRYAGDPSRGKLTGYKFDVQVKAGGFQVTAVPEKYGVTGNRSFYLDESNVMHAADKKGAPATQSDPEV
ncbi:MAG TPA: hypothetical protein VKN18_10510 [Blastocatellia bacterium]|nr:hypothetical protein [Blastocatellia bacterium]